MSTELVSNNNGEVITPEGKNRTIEYGMKLLACSPQAPSAVIAKQVGLQLVLLGMSEIQAKRISNLAIAAYELEQRLYAPEIIQSIDTKKLLSTYQAVSTALEQSLQYVTATQAMDWSAINTKLKSVISANEGAIQSDPEADDNKRLVTAAARDLLAVIQNGNAQ